MMQRVETESGLNIESWPVNQKTGERRDCLLYRKYPCMCFVLKFGAGKFSFSVTSPTG